MKAPITHDRPLTVTLTLREWSAVTGVKEGTIRWRLKQGFCPEEAITLPKSRLTFRDRCSRGHLATPGNLYIDPRGTAQCRECRKLVKSKTPRPLSFAQLKARSRQFWSKVSRKKNGCWPWSAGRSGKGGYGQFSLRYRQIGAHRAALSLKLGRLVKGMACHKCGNPSCCRPSHLYEGNSKTNARDAIRHGKTRRGELSSSAKLTKADVMNIRARHGAVSLTTLARRYDVSVSTIDAVVRKITWKWL